MGSGQGLQMTVRRAAYCQPPELGSPRPGRGGTEGLGLRLGTLQAVDPAHTPDSPDWSLHPII